MAPTSLSSATSTSHTLSGDLILPPTIDPSSILDQDLFSILAASPHFFLQPPTSLHSVSLATAKSQLDVVAQDTIRTQESRNRDEREKRKRPSKDSSFTDRPTLRLKRLHLEGLSINHIFEQAKCVLDITTKELERDVAHSLQDIQSEALEPSRNGQGVDGSRGLVHFDHQSIQHTGFTDHPTSLTKQLNSEIVDNLRAFRQAGGLSLYDAADTLGKGMTHSTKGDLGETLKPTGNGQRAKEVGTSSSTGRIVCFDGQGEARHRGESNEESEDDDTNDPDKSSNGASEDSPDGSLDGGSGINDEVYTEDPHGLNDGFFSIDDFNKQTEFLEHQDTAADPFTGAASDEEEIDWDAEPKALDLSNTNKTYKKKKLVQHESDEDDGPTFGNVDLNASDDESQDEDGGDELDLDANAAYNTNDIQYRDFFEPPPQKASKRKPQPSTPKTSNKKSILAKNQNEEPIQRTIDAVRRDLFEDELSANSESENNIKPLDPSNPKSRRSTHERRQAKLAEEIRRLEAANVAKREWTLSGEARAIERPINSLLEQDLDFERTGKPLPVITAEVSESIDNLIKRRIIAKDFNEVIRRRPDNIVTGPTARRGRFELDETKAQKSLAEIYETDHLKKVDPTGFVDEVDAKLQKEYDEVTEMWNGISARLDSLTNWHYKPKPPVPSLTIVAAVSTINMEDAQPSTAVGGLGGSMLAPQEVYTPGQSKEATLAGEVVRGGVPLARQELTREEKLRRRRREKERLKKKLGNEVPEEGKNAVKSKAKKDTMAELKRAGVKVIGRRGEVTDVEGKEVKEKRAVKGASGFKL
ncbi:MAG: U3 snoRNP protein [Trizodia sp. TS-e1964]|nr:MAG: U3 snoRNP protein [Trizodia sp. TS-e1964]